MSEIEPEELAMSLTLEVLLQLFAWLRDLHADNRIDGSIVIRGAPEHLGFDFLFGQFRSGFIEHATAQKTEDLGQSRRFTEFEATPRFAGPVPNTPLSMGTLI
jgi:hypothetical protein